MRVAVLTISDSASKGEREDLSGPAVVAFLPRAGLEVTSSLCVSDDIPRISASKLRAVADSSRVDVLLTTGGTGIGPRDTPRRSLPRQSLTGLVPEDSPKRMRRKGMEHTPTAALSRGNRGSANQDTHRELAGKPQRRRLNRWKRSRTLLAGTR